MKKALLFLFLNLFVLLSFSQHLSFQSVKTDSLDTTTLFELVTKLEKRTDKINVYLNTLGSFNFYFNDNNHYENTAFKMDQLRIEIKGNINEWIFYRYRQRLNRTNNAQGLDNVPTSIDYAAVGFQITRQFSIFAGKQCAVFGGIEFDLNPIEVYESSDLSNNMNSFLTGVDFSYWLNNNHQLQFQVLNSRVGSFEEMYGNVPEGIEAPKTPLGYTLNWNGCFFEHVFKTRWSGSVFHDAKHKNMYYFALGNQLTLQKFKMFFDFLHSTEELDKRGIITNLGEEGNIAFRALNTRYMALMVQFEYRICPKFNISFKGMYETAKVYKNNSGYEKGKYGTFWGYIGAFEYYPMKDNLHFFLTYVGRARLYTDKAKNLGNSNEHPQRLSLGISYQIPIF